MAVLLLTLTWKGSSAPNIEGAATATGPGVAFTKSQSCGSCHTLKADGLGRQHRPEPRQRQARLHPRRSSASRTARAPMPVVQGPADAAQIKCIATVVATVSERRRGSPTPAGGRLQGLPLARPGRAGALDAPAAVRVRIGYPARVRFFLGITGASGAPYAARVLAGLTAAGAEVGVCASRAAGEVIAYEVYRDRSLDPAEAVRRLVAEHGGEHTTLYAERGLVLALRLGLGEGRRLRDLPVLDGDGGHDRLLRAGEPDPPRGRRGAQGGPAARARAARDAALGDPPRGAAQAPRRPVR